MKIIKRDGTREDFDPNKTHRVVIAAGLSEEKADTLVKNVSRWIDLQKKPELSSLALRDKVLEELESLDEYSANMYRWYQKTKKNGG